MAMHAPVEVTKNLQQTEQTSHRDAALDDPTAIPDFCSIFPWSPEMQMTLHQ
jgi:hypothetical protein